MEPSALWVILGVVLLIIEMATLTFTLIFISLGCFAAAVLSYIPNFESNYILQGITCAMIAVIGLLGFRKQLQSRMLKSVTLKADIGKEIIIDHGIHAHQTARISYQGSSWQVTNLDAEEISKGDRVCIVGIDGNALLIRKVF